MANSLQPTATQIGNDKIDRVQDIRGIAMIIAMIIMVNLFGKIKLTK